MTAANANAVVSQISVQASASRTEMTRERRWKTPRSRARRTRMKLRKQIHRTTTHLRMCGSLAGCVDASVSAASSVELRVDDWTPRRVRAATPYQLSSVPLLLTPVNRDRGSDAVVSGLPPRIHL